MDDKKVCSLCGKEFTFMQNLRRHMHKLHNVVQKNNSGKLHCPKCDIVIPTYKHLREHLAGTHGIEIEKEEKFFESVEEFKAWKTFVEKSNSDRYVRISSSKKIKSGSKAYYYCHRSGLHESKATGKKMIKIQGSNKVGATCPSSMVVTEYDDHPGQVWVTYWKTHVGHDHKRSRAFLAENERDFIAKKLATGVSFDNVLDEMINGETEVNSEALHPIDNPDLHSMKRFLSNCSNYHPDDIASVELLIQELELSNEMAILYYKPQGEVDETGHFEIDDFMIIFISYFQFKMIATFYSEIFCVDAVIGKNKYDYQAVLILTVDENAVGYPFATCITNRTDVKAVARFFEKVRDSLSEDLECNVLLTADIPAIVSAWSAVMGEPKHHLLSSWHVIKALQKHLRKIKIPRYRTHVFQYLQVLIHEPNVERFEKLLVCFENDLKENQSSSYYNYFQRNYLKRIKQWALCHRVELGIKTNKHFEAFHEILRYIYIDGKKNHRLDNFLKALLKLTRDKLFDRRSMSLKNKPSQIKHEMQENHAKGRLIAKSKVTCVSEGSYRVASKQELNYSYTITKENVDHSTCDMTCTACKICIHMYSCTCIDYLVKFTICKHIHACIISTWPDVVLPESCDDTVCEVNDDVSDVVTLQLNGKDISTMSPIINLAGEIIVSSNAVTEIAEDAYNKIIEHLQIANNILKNAISGTQQIQSLVVPSVSEIPDSTGEIEIVCKNLVTFDHAYVVLNENIEC